MTDFVIIDDNKIDIDSPLVGVDEDQSGASNLLANMRLYLTRDGHLREVYTRVQDADFAIGGLTTDDIDPDAMDAFTGTGTVDPARVNKCGGTSAATAGVLSANPENPNFPGVPNSGIFLSKPDAAAAPGKLSALKAFAIISFSEEFSFQGTDGGGSFPATELALVPVATSGWTVDSGFLFWSWNRSITGGDPDLNDLDIVMNTFYTPGTAELRISVTVDSVNSGADVGVNVSGRITVWEPT